MPRERSDEISKLLYINNFSNNPRLCIRIDNQNLLGGIHKSLPQATAEELISQSNVQFLTEINNGNWDHFNIIIRQILRITILLALQSENPVTIRYGAVIFNFIWNLDDVIHLCYKPYTIKDCQDTINKDPQELKRRLLNSLDVVNKNNPSTLLNNLLSKANIPDSQELFKGSIQSLNNYCNDFIEYALSSLPLKQELGGDKQNESKEQEGTKITEKDSGGKEYNELILEEHERILLENLLRFIIAKATVLGLPFTLQMFQEICLQPFNAQTDVWFLGKINQLSGIPASLYSEPRLAWRYCDENHLQDDTEEKYSERYLIKYLYQGNRVLIASGYGTGKTTLLQHMARTISLDSLGSLDNPKEIRLPVIVDVQEMNRRHLVQDVADMVALDWEAAKIDPRATKEDFLRLLKKLIEANKVIWLIDHLPAEIGGTLTLTGKSLQAEIPIKNPMVICLINPNRFIIQSMLSEYKLSNINKYLTISSWDDEQIISFIHLYIEECKKGLQSDETLSYLRSLVPELPETLINQLNLQIYFGNKRIEMEADRKQFLKELGCKNIKTINLGIGNITPLDIVNYCVSHENRCLGAEHVYYLNLLRKITKNKLQGLHVPDYYDSPFTKKENPIVPILLKIVKIYYDQTKSTAGDIPFSKWQFESWFGEKPSVDPKSHLYDLLNRQILSREYLGSRYYFTDPNDYRLLYSSGWLKRHYATDWPQPEIIPDEGTKIFINYLHRLTDYEAEYFSGKGINNW